MFIIILLSSLALWGIVSTIIEVRRGGPRSVATDWSRVADHDLAPHDRAELVAGYR